MLPQESQVSMQVARGLSGFLLSWFRGLGPHLTLRGETPGFPQVAAGNLGFFSSYDGDLRDPLVLPQESQVYIPVKGPLRIPLHSVRGLRSSSGFDTGTSGSLFSADMDLGVPI